MYSSILYHFRVIWCWIILWWWNLVKSLKVTGNGTIWQIAYEFLLAFPSSYGPILYHFQDRGRYWPKIMIFSYPLHLMPIRVVRIGILSHMVWYGKTTMVYIWWYKKFAVCMITRFDIIHKCDRQQDRQSDRQRLHNGTGCTMLWNTLICLWTWCLHDYKWLWTVL